jgi:hypothetical protein
MKTFDSISPSDCLDKFCFVEVSDLVASAIAGGVALVSVEATAQAYGPSTYTYTGANTRLTDLDGRASIAMGWDTAVAIGDSTSANVSVFATGDKTIQQTQTLSFNGMTVSSGFVTAIDYP